MDVDVLRRLLEKRPFEPLMVELSNGQVISIKYPEGVQILKKTLVVIDLETETIQWTALANVAAVRRRWTPIPSS